MFFISSNLTYTLKECLWDKLYQKCSQGGEIMCPLYWAFLNETHWEMTC